MKRISYLFSLSFMMMTSVFQAQDLGDLFLKAHYTLINTEEDALGMQPPIELINAPFDGNQGVYSNGIYIGSGNPDACWIHTPFQEALFENVFAVQLEFKIETLSGVTDPVMIIGDHTRYLGFGINWDSTFLIVINYIYTDLPGIIMAEEEIWYEVTIFYDGNESEARFYLDGILIDAVSIVLDRTETEGNISNTHGGTGNTFKGHWRNLKIYGSEPISAVNDENNPGFNFNFSPNPVHEYLHVDDEGSDMYSWKLYDMRGIMIKEGERPVNQEIDFTSYAPGMYMLSVVDRANTHHQRKVIKSN